MVQEMAPAASLRAAVEKARKTVHSTSLIEASVLGPLEALQQAQRQFLLDSFATNKLNKDYKHWEAQERDSFVNNDVLAYNKRVAQMARLNDEVNTLNSEYDILRASISLPDLSFSMQTIQTYENGRLLQNVPKSQDGKLPLKVRLNELFSLDKLLETPPPTFSEFKDLVNLEYRLRMQRQIKYEVLLVVKQQLTAKNNKWAARDSSLNQFITRDLPSMFDEVAKIKQSEYEDLRHYNDEDEDEESDQENAYVDEHEESGPENDDGRELDNGPENEDAGSKSDVNGLETEELGQEGPARENGRQENDDMDDGAQTNGPETENGASDRDETIPAFETPLEVAPEAAGGADDELMEGAEGAIVAEEDHDEIMNIDG